MHLPVYLQFCRGTSEVLVPFKNQKNTREFDVHIYESSKVSKMFYFDSNIKQKTKDLNHIP